MVATAVASCGSSASPSSSGSGSSSQATLPNNTAGVTPTSVKISVLGQFSGTAGPILNQWFDSSIQVWADGVNKKGGINGRQVELAKLDTQDTPEGGTEACKEVESNGSFAAMVVEGVNGHIPAIECLDQAQIPVIYNYPDPRLTANLKYAYSVAAPFDDQKGMVLVRFIKNYLHEGDKKIGVLYRSDSPVYAITGTDFVASAKSSNLNVVDVETATASQSSYTSQLQRLKSAGADIVMVAGDVEMYIAPGQAKAIGFSPQWVGPQGWANDLTTSVVGPLIQGDKMISALVGTNSPAYTEYAAAATADGKKPVRDSLYFYSYALVMGHELQAAGKNLTRSSFLAAIQATSNFDPQVAPPISWSKTKHSGTDAVFPVQCCNSAKQWIQLGPATTF